MVYQRRWGSVDRPKLTLPNELVSPIGLAVSEPDRFTVEITRDRHFEQRFDRVVDLSGTFEHGFLDTIGELCQDDLSGRGRQLFERRGLHRFMVGAEF
jgi:hypothetical protein